MLGRRYGSSLESTTRRRGGRVGRVQSVSAEDEALIAPNTHIRFLIE
jgi:hypothetical protein